MNLLTLNNLFLLLTGLTAAYLIWRFYTRWSKGKKLFDCILPDGFPRFAGVWLAAHLSGYGHTVLPIRPDSGIPDPTRYLDWYR